MQDMGSNPIPPMLIMGFSKIMYHTSKLSAIESSSIPNGFEPHHIILIIINFYYLIVELTFDG